MILWFGFSEAAQPSLSKTFWRLWGLQILA